jgi:hypothetical protein
MSSERLPDTLSEIEAAPPNKNVPSLVLIHDGGGTIFNYYTIGPLNRQVFGIADPAFESGDEWEGWDGGIVQMAEQYCHRIRRSVEKTDILLGGK